MEIAHATAAPRPPRIAITRCARPARSWASHYGADATPVPEWCEHTLMQRGGWRRGAALGLAAAVLAVVVLVAGLVSGCAGGSKAQATAETQSPTQANQAAGTGGRRSVPAGNVILRIRGAVAGRPFPGGFVGLSLEYPAVAAYAGSEPVGAESGVRPADPESEPRDSCRCCASVATARDWTWWPVAGMKQPAGVNYTLTPGYVSVLHSLATTLGAKLILGIDLEADSTSSGVGRGEGAGQWHRPGPGHRARARERARAVRRLHLGPVGADGAPAWV